MAQVVINAFGGEGTLFTRTFLAALPAWPWKDAADSTIMVRWLDLANQQTGESGTTDASKTNDMLKAVGGKGGNQAVAEMLKKVFGVPLIMTDAPAMSTGENTIKKAYASHSDFELLSLQFTDAEIAESHATGFQGDPCAGTACIRGQKEPLPEGYYTPTANGTPMQPTIWITVGGFRGGGCATTLVPLEARNRKAVSALNSVESVLIAALPYSSHEEDPDDAALPQLKSGFAFSGTKAILSGGFEIADWDKRYFVSTYLEDGKLIRPVTAGYNVNEQNTTLIGTNLVTADCAYRAIMGKDDKGSFGSDKVYIPAVGEKIESAFDYNLCVDIKKMRALCWFSALIKELWCGWDRHINKTDFAGAGNTAAKDFVGAMKNYCDEMMTVFSEIQRGRYAHAADQTAMPFAFMPNAFFRNYFAGYSASWWDTLVVGDPSDKSDDFRWGLFGCDYADWNGVSAQVLNKALKKCKGDVIAAMAALYQRMQDDIDKWGYVSEHSSKAGGKTRLLLPINAAVGDSFISFGTSDSPVTESSVMGAVNSESGKNNWHGYIGGPCGRFFDFEARLKNGKVDETSEIVVKYTALLLSHFLKNLREIGITKKTLHVTDSKSIFADMQTHLGFDDGIHICQIGSYKVGSYIKARLNDSGKAESGAYYILPTPGDWGTVKKKIQKPDGKWETTYYCESDDSPWAQLVGLNLQTGAVPKSVDEVLRDLTAFEALIVFTMLYAINHYRKGDGGSNPSGMLQASRSNNGYMHPYYEFVAGVLNLLEEKVRNLLSRFNISDKMPADATWESIDYSFPVCTFIREQIFPPNKIFTHKLAYYRMEKTDKDTCGGIYCAYPFTGASARLLRNFKKCDLTVQAKLSSTFEDAESVTVTMTFTRLTLKFIEDVGGQQIVTETDIPETRSYTYSKSQLTRIATMPSISMVPQFLGYEHGTDAPTCEFTYIWIAYGGTTQRKPRLLATPTRGLNLTLPDLPADAEWTICQKVQRVAGQEVDGAWSARSAQERFFWTICNAQDPSDTYGSLGRKPLKLKSSAPAANQSLTFEPPKDYELELYFDFGTANSHIDVYERPTTNADEEAFAPGKSAYCLTLDLEDEFTDDGILKLHDENMTPTGPRKGTIPTMIQIYATPGQENVPCTLSPNSPQYSVGRIVYPSKETMGRIYRFAIGGADGQSGGATVQSLKNLGFVDQMKVNSTLAPVVQAMMNQRAFFMRGFLQNVLAKYYTKYRAWPKNLMLYCSYPTVELLQSYQQQLGTMFPNPATPMDPAITQRLYFASEAVSFVAYVGGLSKNIVTIDIGAGTTDIAVVKIRNTNEIGPDGAVKKELYVIRRASLQYAGMNIVEQSIIEYLKPLIDSGSIDSVFLPMDPERKTMLDNLLKDTSDGGTDSLRMLVRNLISDFIKSPQFFGEGLKFRMALRTIGLLLAIKDMIGDELDDYDLLLHGGPIKSLQNMTFGSSSEQWSFADIVQRIFGRAPSWDSQKEAITRGMYHIAYDDNQCAKTLSHNRVAMLSDEEQAQMKPYLEQINLKSRQIPITFDSPGAAGTYDIPFKSCDIRKLAEDVIKAFALCSPERSIDDVHPYTAQNKNVALRKLVDKIVAVKGDAQVAMAVQQDIPKCEFYEGMDQRLLAMYVIDHALRDNEVNFKGW